MIRIVRIVYVALILSFSSSTESKEVQSKPKFIDNKIQVQKKFNKNIKLNLSNRKSRQFKTLLEGSSLGPPNFAGKYVIVTWGCGSSCQRHALINKTNGEVFWPKEIEASFNLFACEMDTLEFRPDSNLLIINEPESSEGFIKVFYYWDGFKMKKLYSVTPNKDELCNLK